MSFMVEIEAIVPKSQITTYKNKSIQTYQFENSKKSYIFVLF